jgi:alanine racemase
MRRIEVDLEAIASNYKVLKRIAGNKVMAIVKADAFGHGAIAVSKKLEEVEVDILGVADLDEAFELRDAGIKAPIMAWLHGKEADFKKAVELDIQIGLATVQGLEKLENSIAQLPKRAKVHLKVDTGLGRNGASLQDWPFVIEKAVELQNKNLLEVEGLFSHLSGTSEAEDEKQLKVFEECLELARAKGLSFKTQHLAASLATLSNKKTHLGMVRVGLALYGLDPSESVRAKDFGLVSAMRVVSEVVQVKRVPKGHGVSYGYLHRTKGEANLALVPFGYAEGLPRLASGRAEVLLNGKRYRIESRIAMDQFVLDLGDDVAEVGDEVVIFGSADAGEPTAEQLAKAAETINYEIVTRIGGRAKRVYK